MSGFFADLRSVILAPPTIAAWAVFSVLVAYVGPFGTYDTVHFLTRVLYWSVALGLWLLVGMALRTLLERRFPDWRHWTVSVITATALALVLAEPLRLYSLLVAHGQARLVPSFSELAFFIFTLSIGYAAMRVLTLAHQVDESAVPERVEIEEKGENRLLQRVEPGLRGDLVRISVFDHYVSVVTDRGEDRLLMRFGDALTEVQDIPGLQVHRSHWVALDAVRGHEIEKGRLFLLTSDGGRVPVSRNHKAAVAETGLI